MSRNEVAVLSEAELIRLVNLQLGTFGSRSVDPRVHELDGRWIMKCSAMMRGPVYCRCTNFVKELVILFHRTAAAPWGHVASIIKRSSTGDSSSILVPLPPLLAKGPFVAALDGIRIWYLPPAGTQERRMHVLSLKEQDTQTVKFQQAFYLQTFTHQTLPTTPSPYYQTLQPSHNKPILTLSYTFTL